MVNQAELTTFPRNDSYSLPIYTKILSLQFFFKYVGLGRVMLCYLFPTGCSGIVFCTPTVFLSPPPRAMSRFLKPTEKAKGISSPVSRLVTFRLHHHEVKRLYIWQPFLFLSTFSRLQIQNRKPKKGGRGWLTELAMGDQQPHQNPWEVCREWLNERTGRGQNTSLTASISISLP